MTRNGEMTDQPLFVYGSLLEPKVLETLLNRVPETDLAVAQGFIALQFPGQPFPVLVPRADSVTTGHLLPDLTLEERALLDAFEHPIYDVSKIDVMVSDQSREAAAYTVSREKAMAIGAMHPWNLSILQETLGPYLEMCSHFRQNYSEKLS